MGVWGEFTNLQTKRTCTYWADPEENTNGAPSTRGSDLEDNTLDLQSKHDVKMDPNLGSCGVEGEYITCGKNVNHYQCLEATAFVLLGDLSPCTRSPVTPLSRAHGETKWRVPMERERLQDHTGKDVHVPASQLNGIAGVSTGETS